jgi:hypothetical protein
MLKKEKKKRRQRGNMTIVRKTNLLCSYTSCVPQDLRKTNLLCSSRLNKNKPPVFLKT